MGVMLFQMLYGRRPFGEGLRCLCGLCAVQVDVWAVGVMLFQMLYGRRPFGEGLKCLFWLCWARRWTFGRWA